ncbi:unnamed protein product [Rotaria magnacalcarata]|uniref:Regulator of G-protein signaling 22 n=2 Tax=Rotaria magnacalcarata TaxID=392030 RepID=A0A814W9V0_9BILA|nr:unnamed protein product [Rotaria magnacalcarata]CAF3823464.1 unnamed protein product [Rotaria magnacalcarata]
MPEQPSASFADSCTIHDFDELLSLDDIFVEYFNEFLRLGTFVQKLEYNRELNTFIEKISDNLLNTNNEQLLIDDNVKKTDDTDTNSLYSGFSDIIQLDEVPEHTKRRNANSQKTHQSQIMDWVKTERLGLFWRTEFYRQYKLCKLILRPIANENEPSEYSSQGIGGYSRQSVYTAARTLSTDNSTGHGMAQTATLEEDEEQQDEEQNEPFANANTMFENNIMVSEILRMPKAFLRPGSRAYSVPANLVSCLAIFFPSLQPRQLGKMSKRSSSSKTSQRKSLPRDNENNSSDDPNDPNSLSMYSSVKMKYFEETENEEDSNDIGDFGLEIQSSSSQLKYKYLGSFQGMQSFVRFLQTTKGGYDLYRFWMDCEFFKDTMLGLDQVENVAARTRLFRDLNDGKYHLPFMRHLQNKIRRAYSDSSGILTHDVFLQVQYDVLRRLRMYWSARFIIHRLFQDHHPPLHLPIDMKQPENVCLYPIDERARASLIEMTRVFLSDDYTTNEKIISNEENEENQDKIEESFNNLFMRKYLTIIRQDKQAGGLFLRYVTFKERLLLPLMLFCYDVDDFRYSNVEDKILERQHGLSILNTYFGNSAKLSLDNFMPDIQIRKWVETFHNYKFDKLTFEPLFKRALLILKDAWLRCIKEDVDRFTAAYYLTSSPAPSIIGSDEDEDDEDEDEKHGERQKRVVPASKKQMQRKGSPNTEIQVSHDAIYIKRPWLTRFVPSAPTERQERFLEALENAMTDDERQRLRAEKLERLRKIEENRKRALKAARERRLKQAQEKSATTNTEKNAQMRRRETGVYIDRVLPSKIATMAKDSQRLFLTDFQHFTKSSKTAPTKFEQKLSFIFEVIKWMESTNSYEKQQQLDRLRKTYFDVNSKRNILPLSDEQSETLAINDGRPDSQFIQNVYREIHNAFEDEFVRYCNERIQEFEIDSIDDFLSKSYDELTLLFNDVNDGRKGGADDDDMGALFDPDVEALASNNDGTGKTTKKHYAELFQLIADAAVGRFNERFYYFYAYLTHWVDEKKAPYIDQDFLFCIDANRIKEISNDLMLQAKVRYVLETYFEANVTSNAFNCRLDFTNTDLQTRIVRSLQKYLTSNVNDFPSLEEARTVLVKDKLVYYYAGFKAYLFRMNLIKTHPSRLARLQEQLNLYQQQQRANKSAKTTTRSSASTNKNSLPRKNVSVTSKSHPIPPSTPVDLTTMTKTQRILNERMKTFDKIPPNKVNDIFFPVINKTTRQRSPTNNGKSRTTHNQDTHTTHAESMNSFKEKPRGPVLVQYTLTSGIKVKYSDGKPFEESANAAAAGGGGGGGGGGAQPRRTSGVYSIVSGND